MEGSESRSALEVSRDRDRLVIEPRRFVFNARAQANIPGISRAGMNLAVFIHVIFLRYSESYLHQLVRRSHW